MRFDLSPLYRTTVGFDRVFDLLESAAAQLDHAQNWPPYNVEKTGDDRYRIRMVVAGFRADEVEVSAEANLLTVTGHKPDAKEHDAQVLHRGIAVRSFKQAFELADHVMVSGAALADGLLTVDLVRELPEVMKPRRIEIVAEGGKALSHEKEKAA